MRSGGKWSATWFCEDRVHRASGTSGQLVLGCGGREFAFSTGAHQAGSVGVADAGQAAVPEGDIEGNIGFLDTALVRLRVVDGRATGPTAPTAS